MTQETTIGPSVGKMQHFLEEKLPFYLDLLRQMVAVNSFTANAVGVNRLAQLTADIFAPLGFTAEQIPSTHPAYGGHLVLTRPGGGGRRVGLISHLDTVFPPEEEIANDFRWREEGQRIYGPGTVDIKGGTLGIYMVLDALRHLTPELFEQTEWVVLLNSSEEVLAKDFGQLCLERLPATDTLACLIFEGGQIDARHARFVVARKGRAVFRISAEGRAAHAGTSHREGANAIVALAEAVQAIAGLTDYERDLTFTVGTIDGGTVVNRVPHAASAEVEMRAFTGEVFEDALAKILALPEQIEVVSGDGEYRGRLAVEVLYQTRPWPRNAATEWLFERWQKAGELLGIDVIREARGGLSDGNALWDILPTLDGLGPAGGNAHCSERSVDGTKDQEYVDRDSFVPGAMLNVLAVVDLLLNADGAPRQPAPEATTVAE
ncbi:MAG: M20/M25/M40 family metallo-hydrolase [Candidatus Promineifilaceae bacterium]|nr:M20/M25/M40 family metallo-hydrolase [Candidatus Promineifilaceae bacterium]